MGALQPPAAVRVLRTESLPGCLEVPGGRRETPHGGYRGQPLTQPLQAGGWGWAETTRRGTAWAGLAGRGAGRRWDPSGPPHEALCGWQRLGQRRCYMGAVGSDETESVSFSFNIHICVFQV